MSKVKLAGKFDSIERHAFGLEYRNGVELRCCWGRTSVKGSCRATMLRRITTFLVLGALAGIYAFPLAAAIFPSGISDCCAHGMCPRMKHAAKTETEDDAMPDCAMNDQKSGAPVACKCVASPCETHTGKTISIPRNHQAVGHWMFSASGLVPA